MKTVINLFVLIFAISANAQSVQEPINSRTLRAELFEILTLPRDVVMMGDSLTERGEWSELLPSSILVANRGIGGDTIGNMLARAAVVLSVHPKRIYVMAGINDLVHMQERLPMTELLQQYQTLVNTLGSEGAEVIVQSTLFVSTTRAAFVNPRVAELNAGMKRYCARARCDYIDVNAKLAPRGVLLSKYSGDGVHLAPAGYLAWARLVSENLAVGRAAHN